MKHESLIEFNLYDSTHTMSLRCIRALTPRTKDSEDVATHVGIRILSGYEDYTIYTIPGDYMIAHTDVYERTVGHPFRMFCMGYVSMSPIECLDFVRKVGRPSRLGAWAWYLAPSLFNRPITCVTAAAKIATAIHDINPELVEYLQHCNWPEDVRRSGSISLFPTHLKEHA